MSTRPRTTPINSRTNYQRAGACGIPADHLICHDEPVILNSTGGQEHDRQQITVSFTQLWYIVLGLSELAARDRIGGTGRDNPRAEVRELTDQLRGFWEAIQAGEASRTGAHAPALRLSNRDGFHSGKQADRT